MKSTVIKTNNSNTTEQVVERIIVKTEQIETIKVIKTVSELKEQLLLDLKNKFIELSQKPRVEVKLQRTSLTKADSIGNTTLIEDLEGVSIFVDGGRTNKDDFKEKWEDMADAETETHIDETTGEEIITVITPEETSTVKDADNMYCLDITKSEMFLIYKAIYKNGEELYNWKWAKEAEIEACTTIEELEAISI